MPQHTEQRSKDVLFALSEAGEYNVDLNRLQLQKLIYLFDVLALSWRHVGATPAFRPWYNGPYDSTIQNAVDALAFRGFVTVTHVSFRRTKNVEARYRLNEAGVAAVTELAANAAMAHDRQLFREIAREVDSRDWAKIKELVYAEPTYNRARSRTQIARLPVGNVIENLSWRLLNDVKAAFNVDRPSPMSPRTLVQVLFAILDEYRLSPESSVPKRD